MNEDYKFYEKSFKKQGIIFVAGSIILILIIQFLPELYFFITKLFLKKGVVITSNWDWPNSIALFAALLAGIGILYNNNESNNRINRQLNWKDRKNSLKI